MAENIGHNFRFIISSGRTGPSGLQICIKVYKHRSIVSWYKGHVNNLGLRLRWRNCLMKGAGRYIGISGNILHHWWSNCFLKTGIEGDFTIGAGDLLLFFTARPKNAPLFRGRRFSPYSVGLPSQSTNQMGSGRFFCENVEGPDEITLGTSGFQWKGAELVEPFLI